MLRSIHSPVVQRRVLAGAALFGIALLGAPNAAAQAGFRPLPSLPARSFAYPVSAAAPAPGTENIGAIEAVGNLGAIQPDGDDPVFIEMELYGIGLRAGDSEAGPGDLETVRGGWRGRLGRATEHHVFGVEVGLEGSFYSFGGNTNVAPGSDDPFNDLYQTSVAFSLETRPDDTGFGYFAGLETTLGGEDEIGPFDGLTLSGVGGVRYRKNEDVSLSFGLAAQSRLEDDAIVWPFVGFDWRLAERWVLTLFGPEIELDYEVNERWTAFARADYDLRQFRLNDEGPLEGAALRDEEIRLGGGVLWSSPSGFAVRAETGLVMWRELNFRNDGELVTQTEFDPAPYAALELAMRF